MNNKNVGRWKCRYIWENLHNWIFIVSKFTSQYLGKLVNFNFASSNRRIARIRKQKDVEDYANLQNSFLLPLSPLLSVIRHSIVDCVKKIVRWQQYWNKIVEIVKLKCRRWFQFFCFSPCRFFLSLYFLLFFILSIGNRILQMARGDVPKHKNCIQLDKVNMLRILAKNYITNNLNLEFNNFKYTFLCSREKTKTFTLEYLHSSTTSLICHMKYWNSISKFHISNKSCSWSDIYSTRRGKYMKTTEKFNFVFYWRRF